MSRKITVALAGNPNSGKTTIFNRLTGARQHVGNYPGVTVEKKEGSLKYGDYEINVVDLPGTYGLTAYSIEEVVARNFLIDEKPDVVVDILDASNLERNLYLATQFMEMGVPLVLALNMSDVARNRGIEFDLAKLSRLLGAPIVPTVGCKGTGTRELLESMVSVAVNGNGHRRVEINYGKEISEEIEKLQRIVETRAFIGEKYDARWFSIKLLEGDKELLEKVGSEDVLSAVRVGAEHLEKVLGDAPEILIADRRYGFISGACQEAVKSTVEARHNMSDRIDAVMTNQVLGLPIFFGLMYLVFFLTFALGEHPMVWIQSLFQWMGEGVNRWWPVGSESALRSLLVDGIIGGVGGVIVFLPNIILLFLAIAILEDTGYMARAAFIMDRWMHKIGLHGKSFIPMLIGFGCSVPAIMATRTLENRRDRLTTMLITPLMSCGARLPIYALIIPAFFPEAWQAPMLWLIYMIGILLAIASAKLLRATIFKGESTPLVMELPPYRIPTLKGVLIHMWERAWLYVRKAGTVILGISILMWALTSYPKKDLSKSDLEALNVQGAKPEQVEHARQAEALTHSVAGRIGRGLEPLIRPLGFDWRIGTALIGAFAAKEVFVAQMGVVYSLGESDGESEGLRDKLREHYTPLVGFCIMLFCLVSAPCMATVAVTKQESGQWRWALFQFAGLTVLAYVLTLIFYQAGTLVGLGTA